MMNLIHTGLEVVILLLLFFVMIRLESLQRSIDNLAGHNPDAEQPVEDAQAPEAQEQESV